MIAQLIDSEDAPVIGAEPSRAWTWGAIALDITLWGLVILFACTTPAKAAELPAIGASCSYTYPGTLQPWRATVQAIAPGAGGIPWAWLTIDADPRRLVKLPAAELQGCK